MRCRSLILGLAGERRHDGARAGGAHSPARPAGRAERDRRHAAVARTPSPTSSRPSAASTSTSRSTSSSSTRSCRSTRTASRPTSSPSPTSSRRPASQRAGGAEYLHTLTGLVPTAANAGYYAVDRRRAGGAAPPGRGRHPHRADGLRERGRGRSISSTTPRRRSTPSPAARRPRTTSRSPRPSPRRSTRSRRHVAATAR